MSKGDGSSSSEGRKDTAGSKSRRGKPSAPERTRTPSPPLSKLSTIPYPGPGAPSTSFLMPPSLSFTSPTPEVSPISPTRPTQHQKSQIDPPVSVLRVPTTPPVARTASSSSHKGKRKADEAGVEGGGTPPKDQKEPRATFAIEPRRKHLTPISYTCLNPYFCYSPSGIRNLRLIACSFLLPPKACQALDNARIATWLSCFCRKPKCCDHRLMVEPRKWPPSISTSTTPSYIPREFPATPRLLKTKPFSSIHPHICFNISTCTISLEVSYLPHA
jgi:hypothetical protein